MLSLKGKEINLTLKSVTLAQYNDKSVILIVISIVNLFMSA